MNRKQSFDPTLTPGSRQYLQFLVNNDKRYLNRLMRNECASLGTWREPIWVSPLSADKFKEYWDDDFLNFIGQTALKNELRKFWPPNGPHWDALARVERKNGERGVILVEAKANIDELANLSYSCGAESGNRRKIEDALSQVKNVLQVGPNADWLGSYYQHANRLAHLYFLHIICKVPSWLVYICFVGGKKAFEPSTEEEWSSPLENVNRALQLPKEHRLSSRIVHIFPSVFNNQ